MSCMVLVLAIAFACLAMATASVSAPSPAAEPTTSSCPAPSPTAPELSQTADTVIGIDLGTTYSCVGVFKNSRIEIVPNDQGNRITPSYVAFDPSSNGERLVGDAAKAQATVNPDNTIFDIKRLIGRKFNDDSVQRDKELFPFKVVEQEGQPRVQVWMCTLH